jgi:hypothetical protein
VPGGRRSWQWPAEAYTTLGPWPRRRAGPGPAGFPSRAPPA